MPASGSQRSSSARATWGWRRLPGAVLTSMSTATPAPRKSSVIRSAVAVPCPNVSSMSARSYAGQAGPGLPGGDEAGGEVAVGDTARAGLAGPRGAGGELGQDPGHVLVMDGGGR